MAKWAITWIETGPPMARHWITTNSRETAIMMRDRLMQDAKFFDVEAFDNAPRYENGTSVYEKLTP